MRDPGAGPAVARRLLLALFLGVAIATQGAGTPPVKVADVPYNQQMVLGLPTFGAMALTIASLTAAYCLTLCAFANAVAEKVRAHRRLTKTLERIAGLFLIGFGFRLVRG